MRLKQRRLLLWNIMFWFSGSYHHLCRFVQFCTFTRSIQERKKNHIYYAPQFCCLALSPIFLFLFLFLFFFFFFYFFFSFSFLFSLSFSLSLLSVTFGLRETWSLYHRHGFGRETFTRKHFVTVETKSMYIDSSSQKARRREEQKSEFSKRGSITTLKKREPGTWITY